MPEEPEEDSDGVPSVTLSDPERAVLAVLRSLGGRRAPESEIATQSGLSSDGVRGTLQRLKSKRLAVVEEQSIAGIRLSVRGEKALKTGLPERRLLTALAQAGGTLGPDKVDTLGLSAQEARAAIGILRRRGYLEAGLPFRLSAKAPDPSVPFVEEATLEQVAEGRAPPEPTPVDALRRRGLVATEHRTGRSWGVSAEGRSLVFVAESTPTVGAVTPELLRSAAWRSVALRPYDVRATVPFLTGARPQPFVAWLEEFEELLVGLGFVQAEGPLVETEFWNADVLFMPQDHPSRSIHDMLQVEDVEGHLPDAALLERVAAVHEGRPLPGDRQPLGPGWRSSYDPQVARRVVLRSQTTAVSARFLAGHPTPPFRMYSLDRNFRHEAVDLAHHVEFAQCEGILGGENVSLRELIGVFRELAEGIGIQEMKIRPSYFPFTEPSIEGYVRHPRLGWIEIFPGGMFRPEVLRPLEVSVPVAAWGIGVTRLAMVSLGVNDIRELFDDDLGRLRAEV